MLTGVEEEFLKIVFQGPTDRGSLDELGPCP
jgi:hypothetical protein